MIGEKRGRSRVDIIGQNGNDGLHYELAESDNPKQVGGDHYDLAVQPIDYIMANGLGYCEGNVVKYITRHGDKNGSEDIRKAIHYCEFLLKQVYGEEP